MQRNILAHRFGAQWIFIDEDDRPPEASRLKRRRETGGACADNQNLRPLMHWEIGARDRFRVRPKGHLAS
jgi:hypothetical protein